MPGRESKIDEEETGTYLEAGRGANNEALCISFNSIFKPDICCSFTAWTTSLDDKSDSLMRWIFF